MRRKELSAKMPVSAVRGCVARLVPAHPQRRQIVGIVYAFFGVAAGTAQAAPSVEAGKAIFIQCASCHQVGPSARAGFGPQLNGLFGRPAAATKDYRYSEAMQRSKIIWTDQTLTAFLKSPGDVVQGTKMRFWGISDQQKISNLLAYLRSFQ